MPRFPYKKLPKYPHLMPADVEIWERFIDSHPNYFDRVDYDVRVGKGVELRLKTSDVYAKDMVGLTKRRIDVVGYKDDTIYIIEVKPRAGLTALGQAFGTARLFADEAPPNKTIKPCIITDTNTLDLERLCDQMGIELLMA